MAALTRADLVVPDHPTLDLHELISGGAVLHLTPGAWLRMCGEGGAGLVVGTYEELCADGLGPDVPLTVGRVFLRLNGFSFLTAPLPSPPVVGAR